MAGEREREWVPAPDVDRTRGGRATALKDTRKRREKDDDDTEDRDTQRVARGAPRADRGREGAHAAQRRAGAAAAGAAVGADRQGVPIRDRRGERLAVRPLPRALAAARLPLHVRARLQGGVSVLLGDRGRVRWLRRPPGQSRRDALGGVAGASR